MSSPPPPTSPPPPLGAFLDNLSAKLDRVESELARTSSSSEAAQVTAGSSAPRRFRSPSTTGAGLGGSPEGSAVLVAELRAVRAALASVSAAAAASTPPAASAPPHTPPGEDATADALRRELKRVSDAFSSLVRETRASKAAWALREAALVADAERLRAAVSGV